MNKTQKLIQAGKLNEAMMYGDKIANALIRTNNRCFDFNQDKKRIQREYDLLHSQVEADRLDLINQIADLKADVKERDSLLDYYSCAYYMGCHHTMKCAVDEHHELRERLKQEKRDD